jgi:hypothetical protein
MLIKNSLKRRLQNCDFTVERIYPIFREWREQQIFAGSLASSL